LCLAINLIREEGVIGKGMFKIRTWVLQHCQPERYTFDPIVYFKHFMKVKWIKGNMRRGGKIQFRSLLCDLRLRSPLFPSEPLLSLWR
jgi:hypothetical protein